MTEYSFKRPTSPVDCEPLLVATEDILYPGSDEEASIEEQRAQRRRIALQAQYHLQGRDLFILSAGLRGPFAEGWVNPWARKRKRKEYEGARRIKQTDGGSAKRRRQEDEATTIPETSNLSSRWLKSDDNVLRQIPKLRSRSPTPTPAMKPPDGTRPILTKLLDPSPSDGNTKARKQSQPAPPRVIESPLGADTSQEITKGTGDLVVGQDAVADVPAASSVEDLQSSLRVIPPSTNLPAFEYRSLIRAEKLEIEQAQAIAKAQEQMFRELSFTSTADMKKLKSRSQKQSQNHTDSPAQRLQEFSKRRRRMNQANSPTRKDGISTVSSKLPPILSNGKNSLEAANQSEVKRLPNSSSKRGQTTEVNFPMERVAESTASSTLPSVSALISTNGKPLEFDDLPEAQIVPVNPVLNGSKPSSLSMNLLVTDEGTIEFSNTQDSSTQAAIRRAMRSFQDDIVTPLNNSPRRLRNQWANPETRPTSAKIFEAKSTRDRVFLNRPHANERHPLELKHPNEEPISTQAMIDAASPFTVTDPGNSSPPHPSPTKFKSSSSNLYSLNTLNIASTGAISNEHLHDGQQQPQAVDIIHNIDDSGFDLDDAIHDAYRFLRTSQMESELRGDIVT